MLNGRGLRVFGDPLAAVRRPDIAGKGDRDTNARRRALAFTGDDSIVGTVSDSIGEPGAAGPVIARGRHPDSATRCRVGSRARRRTLGHPP